MTRTLWLLLVGLLLASCIITTLQGQTEDLVPESETELEDEDDEDEPKIMIPKDKINFTAPKIPDDVHFAMFFDNVNDLKEKMVVSQAKKDDVDITLAKYDGVWSVEVPSLSSIDGDFGLVLKSKAKHHAISSRMARPFNFDSNQLVVQYEVKYQEGIDCGGAYVKLLSHSDQLDLKLFNDKTPYTIMFGPDKCGMDHKLHFIFRHKNPKTGVFEEKHAKKPKADLDKYFTDKRTHLYTLVVNLDNTFEIFVDQTLVNSGNLLEDMSPPVNPEKEIDDPADKKPTDWDERPKIADPEAKKPDDWDETAPEMIVDKDATKPEGWLDSEPAMVPDPAAVKPNDWDVDMDGEWEAPSIENPRCKEAPGCGEWKPAMIKNPLFKGKWSAPMIDNPAYKGIWKPRRIPNPHYYEDSHPFKMTPFSAVGLELWSMTDSVVFDNFFICDNKKDADDFAAATFAIKKVMELKMDPGSRGIMDSIKDVTNERPWIWAVVLLVVLVPLVLLIVWCTRSGSSDEPGSPQHYKKTDQSGPDDEEGEEEEEEDDSGPSGEEQQPTRRGKASLEDDEDEVGEAEKSEQSSGGDASPDTKQSARKRKTRKE